MLVLIMESQSWSLCVFQQKTEAIRLISIDSLPVTSATSQLINAEAIINTFQLQQYSRQEILVGLSLRDLHYQKLSIPSHLKATDYEYYCLLKMSQLMKSSPREIAVDFQVIAERELFAVACHKSHIVSLQQMCRQTDLNLIRCDINFYALVTALSDLGYIRNDEWQLVNGFIIQREQNLEFIKLEKEMIIGHDSLTIGSPESLKEQQVHEYWQQFSGCASANVLYVNDVIAYQLLSERFSPDMITRQNSLNLMIAYGLALRRQL